MTRAERTRIITDYLNTTGANAFDPAAFLAWLQPQPQHRAWPIFFGKDDAAAAHEYRLGLVRSFVSGLRIRVALSDVTPEQREHIKVAIDAPIAVALPAFISPRDGRRDGGGYIRLEPSDDVAMREFYEQAAGDLRRWLDRYGGAAQLAGCDITPITTIIDTLVSACEREEAAA